MKWFGLEAVCVLESLRSLPLRWGEEFRIQFRLQCGRGSWLLNAV